MAGTAPPVGALSPLARLFENRHFLGLLFMLPFGGGLYSALRGAPLSATLAVLYLGICPGALAYVAWAYVMTHGPAGRTSSLLYVIPVLAIFIAWIWLGEIPRSQSLVGGVIALAGVVLVNVRDKGAPPVSQKGTLSEQAAD